MLRPALLLLLACTACHHVSGDGAGIGPPAGSPPSTSGNARFLDVDLDGVAGPGDRVIVRFDAPVAVNSNDASALALLVAGDSFGTGATLAAGPGPDEVTVVLGAGAVLRTRGAFDEAVATEGKPSGVSLADDAPADAIEHAGTGIDAVPGEPGDLWPEPVPGVLNGLRDSSEWIVGADLNRDGIEDLIAANGANGVDVYESLETGGFDSINLAVASAREVLAVDLFAAGRADLAIRTDTQLVTYENLSPAAGPVALGTAETHDLPEPMSSMVDIDWDLDGDRDVLLAGSSGLWLFENSGGALTPPVEPVPGGPGGGRDLAVGDVDENGWDDVLVALPGQNILLLRQVCEGFQLVAQGNADSDHVALVDLDRDGILDALSAGAGLLEVWFGAPGGIFEPAYDLPFAMVTSMLPLDLDGDDACDLILADGLELLVLGNDGEGLLQDAGIALPTGAIDAIAAADVDGDGDDDLALAAEFGNPQVWSGSLVGTFGNPRLREAPFFDVGDGIVYSMVLADVDGDDILDLITGRSLRIEVRLGLGDGSFAIPSVLQFPEGRARGLDVGDVDRDGDLDIAVAMLGVGPNIWLGDGDGGFTPLHLELGIGGGGGASHREVSVAVGDLTGDGFPELVFGTIRLLPVLVYTNGGGDCGGDVGLGGGGFWNGFDLPPDELPLGPLTPDVALEDVDADGDLDVVLGEAGGFPNRIFLNDGEGGLTLSPQAFPVIDTQSVSLADVDRDGDLDLVAAGPQGNLLYHNDGSGDFGVGTPLIGTATFAGLLAPLDGDVLPDLIIGNDLNHGWQALFGTPDGLFSDGVAQRSISISIRTLVVGDLDRDGANDFVTGTGSAEQSNAVWLSR